MQLDELKILLALNGNQRLPHLEEEIFANEEATTIYLHNLCREESWYEHSISSSYLVYVYAREIMQQRWVSAEHIILSSAIHICPYTYYVIKSRWPEAEPYLREDKWTWDNYSDYFGIPAK